MGDTHPPLDSPPQLRGSPRGEKALRGGYSTGAHHRVLASWWPWAYAFYPLKGVTFPNLFLCLSPVVEFSIFLLGLEKLENSCNFVLVVSGRLVLGRLGEW